MKYQDTESIWSRTAQIPGRQPLSGDIKSEAAVIGAGMAGLLTAYFLQKCGKQVIVIEADRIAGGQTKNTTAKITSQHGSIYSELEAKYSQADARLYAYANQEAIAKYESLIEEEGMHCHFERVDSFLYSTKEEASIRRECEAAKRAGIPAHFTTQLPLPFSVKGAVCFEEQAQFHPLEFMKQLAERLTIYENTNALKVKGQCVYTNHGKILAKHIIFATHYPFVNMPGFYFLRQHQERSYAVALSGIKKWDGMYYSVDENGLSFRWFDDLLLVGGTNRRTGDVGMTCNYTELLNRVRQLYPEGKAEAIWSAQDCMTHDDIPFIGRFSRMRPNWFVITGLKKWGMTGSMVAARLVRDQICGVISPYEYLYTPQRFCFQASKQKLWEDVKISVSGLAKGIFAVPFQKDAKRCPHLGCALARNREEGTWECPCHGSRFDETGALLDNPAQKGLNLAGRQITGE